MDDKRLKLVAPCGIDCGICELYTCKDNQQLYNYLVSKGIPEEKLPCKGCRNVKGDCPVLETKCETYTCADSKNINLCGDCTEFPCSNLNPAADRADILPHNTKVFNLSTIKRVGIEKFVDVSQDIKNKYFKGKMVIGKGPQLDEN